MFRTLFLIFVSVIICTVGQVILKIGMNRIGEIGVHDMWGAVRKIATNPFVILALFLYGTGFFVWAIVLSRADLSMAYPILALSYAMVPLAAWGILGEPISLIRWIGILIICLGISVVLKG